MLFVDRRALEQAPAILWSFLSDLGSLLLEPETRRGLLVLCLSLTLCLWLAIRLILPLFYRVSIGIQLGKPAFGVQRVDVVWMTCIMQVDVHLIWRNFIMLQQTVLENTQYLDIITFLEIVSMISKSSNREKLRFSYHAFQKRSIAKLEKNS